MRRPNLHRALPHLTLTLGLALVAGLGLIACGSKSADEASAQESAETAPAEMTSEVSEANDGKPIRIGHGGPVVLAEHAVEGKMTVFDFMSDYCPPCKQISPWLDRLHTERDDVHVVKIDINRPGVKGIDWQSPTLRQFGIRSIPHFKIYGADGTLMQEGQPAYQRIVSWIQALPPEPQSGR